MAGARRLARTVALHALFEVDLTGHRIDEVLQRHFANRQRWLEESLPEDPEVTVPTGRELAAEVQEFATALLQGVISHLHEIDDLIRQAAPAWPLEQMARVDKNILRLAIFEMVYYRRTPLKVVINEAVELGKVYGGETSAKFINGVLGWVSAHPVTSQHDHVE